MYAAADGSYDYIMKNMTSRAARDIVQDKDNGLAGGLKRRSIFLDMEGDVIDLTLDSESPVKSVKNKNQGQTGKIIHESISDGDTAVECVVRRLSPRRSYISSTSKNESRSSAKRCVNIEETGISSVQKNSSSRKPVLQEIKRSNEESRLEDYLNTLKCLVDDSSEAELLDAVKHCLHEKDPVIAAYKLIRDDIESKSKERKRKSDEEEFLMECVCCYVDHPIEEMVQCTEGCLFCTTCLLTYCKETIFGAGKPVLACMNSECPGQGKTVFPEREIRKVLTPELLSKYEERLQQDCLIKADLPDLVRCSFCSFAALLDQDITTFHCIKPDCGKKTCRLCKKAGHEGLKCNEVETGEATALRKQVEEEMSRAMIRSCPKCGTEFLKEDGCNKMRCPKCRALSCYICRELINLEGQAAYTHFCQHPRSPNKGCRRCQKCSLWTNPEQTDDKRIEEIQQRGMEKKRRLTYAEDSLNDRLIGPSVGPSAKKNKRNSYPHAHNH
eukprot:Nk52_evm83s1810 gene=Nk52_evmTU83s1810